MACGREDMCCWLDVNQQRRITYRFPLNPGFVFNLKRKYNATVESTDGAHVRLKRKRPFTELEIRDIYWEVEYRQQRVSKKKNLFFS